MPPKRRPPRAKKAQTKKPGRESGLEEWSAEAVLEPHEWRAETIGLTHYVCRSLSTGDSFVVRVGDDVEMVSEDGPDNIWLAQVQQIRCRKSDIDESSPMIWLLVRWYYSAADLADNLDNFAHLLPATSHFAPRERTLSDKCDIQGFTQVKGCAYVHDWCEQELDPPEIGRDHYFLRGTLHFDDRRFNCPDVFDDACTLCKKPYSPYPKIESSCDTSARQTMHFCPRPKCRRWFHRACLEDGSLEPPIDYIAPRDIRFLAVDPDIQDPHPVFKPYTFHRPTGGKMSNVDHNSESQPWDKVLSELTHGKAGKQGTVGKGLGEGIVKMAMQPILRKPNSEGTFSIAGNVRDVVLARRFVYQFLEGWHDIFEIIKERVDAFNAQLCAAGASVSLSVSEIMASFDVDCRGSDDSYSESEGTVPPKEKGEVLQDANKVAEDAGLKSLLDILKWDIEDGMNCTRLLASPYPPYWEKKAELFMQGDFLSSSPAVMCPLCAGCI
ncbi:hypothetical protein BXZ70DRAFT_49841 [Cristinia sonorae]|uniref:BAH domain-containing protein n=1 Tax=Cristinia sonorae TaxID=1940300 RepID=A0A8K0UR25_9AGAR|nr:hypothetical protein BXZ70DRAFT_49841 [Cristinia sonorae]